MTEQIMLFKTGNRFDYKLDKYIDVKSTEPQRNYNILELFAGAGGLALGCEEAGLTSIGAVEIDKHAAQTLRDNRPEWNVIEGDVNDVLADGILNYIDEPVDIISAGIPCQSFSYAGKRGGFADTRGTLFYPTSEIIGELKPKMFIIENVKGLVNHDEGRTLETMIDILEDQGYKVVWNVLNSWNYDTAQKRERIFIVGTRLDLVEQQSYEFMYPQPQEYKPVLRDVLNNVPDSPGQEYSVKKFEVLKQVRPGGSWVDLPEEVAKEYLGKSWYSGGGKRGMARRLSWDEPSLTLTTSPNQKQTERCHPDETRPLKTREYARIQGFPDDWEFSGSVTEVYKQIGNAVPVKLGQYVAKSLVHYLNQF